MDSDEPFDHASVILHLAGEVTVWENGFFRSEYQNYLRQAEATMIILAEACLSFLRTLRINGIGE